MKKKQITRDQWITTFFGLIVSVGECDEWQGMKTGRVPVYRVPSGYFGCSQKNTKQSARRILLAELGESIKPGHVVRMTCQNDLCMKRGHMVMMNRRASAIENGRRGHFRTPARCAAATATARRRAKLDVEAARVIRSSEESSAVLAERYGVSTGTISAVRRGERFRDGSVIGSSVFNWRPAA